MSPMIFRRQAGFTLLELLVVQVVALVLFGTLFVLYGQAKFLLERGSAKLDMQQRMRQSLVRAIPYISSALPRAESPPNITEALFPPGHPLHIGAVVSPPPPDGTDPDPENPDLSNSTDTQLVLRSTEAYVRRILRQPPDPDDNVFDARNPFPLDEIEEPTVALARGMYRIFFELDPNEDQSNPEFQLGNLWLDGNTPGDPSDDILLASNLHRVEFIHLNNNIVDIEVEVRGYLPQAGGKKVGYESNPDKLIRKTRVFLPIYTNSPGGN